MSREDFLHCVTCYDLFPEEFLDNDQVCEDCVLESHSVIPNDEWDTYLKEEEGERWWEEQDDEYNELDFNDEHH